MSYCICLYKLDDYTHHLMQRLKSYLFPLQCCGSDLLVIHVAGAAQECGPAFGVQLQRSDAVSPVPLTRNFWGQNLKTVPRRQTWGSRGTHTPFSTAEKKTMKIVHSKFFKTSMLYFIKSIQLKLPNNKQNSIHPIIGRRRVQTPMMPQWPR